MKFAFDRTNSIIFFIKYSYNKFDNNSFDNYNDGKYKEKQTKRSLEYFYEPIRAEKIYWMFNDQCSPSPTVPPRPICIRGRVINAGLTLNEWVNKNFLSDLPASVSYEALLISRMHAQPLIR